MQPISRSRMIAPSHPHAVARPAADLHSAPGMVVASRGAVRLQLPELPEDSRPKYTDPFDDPFFGGGYSQPGVAIGAPPAADQLVARPTSLPAPALQRAPSTESVPLTPVPDEEFDGPALFSN